jgi:alcohol dehydrogenase class IV
MIFLFEFSSIPKIIFGPGKIAELYKIIPKFGKNILIVTGERSLEKSGIWEKIRKNLRSADLNYKRVSVSGEPSPSLIDSTVSKFRGKNIDLVVGIGGGSVTDAGKAISAMIPQKDSIVNYLEGVGTKKPDGKKIPYIAVPTTSGTGSEATKNAVISKIGENGFKKSLRHENYIPNIAIIDPELMLSCPASITGACGMDAFTQLLEAYVSTKANPITDALAFSGMKFIKDSLVPATTGKSNDIAIRSRMAYSSLMSGIVLANAGLGIVHGLASPIGGLFEIPHGVVCGTLLAEATKMNIKKLKEKGIEGRPLLLKHADIGALLTGESKVEEGKIHVYLDDLIETLEHWTNSLKIEKLSKFGISIDDINLIVEQAGLKNNPVQLNKEEIKEIVSNRL